MKRYILCAMLCLGAIALTGCGTLIANQVVQARHPEIRRAAIQAAQLNGGAGVGIDLLNLGAIQSLSDAGIQALGAGVDAVMIYGGYRLYERATANNEAAPPAIPNVTTGNNSPVIIHYGDGSPKQINENNPSTSSTTVGQ